MSGVAQAVEGYEQISMEQTGTNEWTLTDKQLGKSAAFESEDITLTTMKQVIQRLAERNDFQYINGQGFYLKGYAEVGIVGFMDEDDQSIFKIGKTYSVGGIEFEVSKKSDLFHFLTWFEDKSRLETLTLKLNGVNKENFSEEIEKVIFYMGTKYKEQMLDDCGDFAYPRTIDVRVSDIPCDEFRYSAINMNIDWSSLEANHLALFNQGETSDNSNFFSYYRFIETFLGEEKSLAELQRRLSTLHPGRILAFAKEAKLIEEHESVEALGEALYEVRNRYVNEQEEDAGYVPFNELGKWKVVTKEVAIQLLNQQNKN